jgi:hypothetical protein
MPPFALVLLCALGPLLLPLRASAAEKAAAPAEPAPAASTPAPGGEQEPLIEETPLLVEARKRAPKELWIEMTQIHSEMQAHAQDEDYPPLADLAKRLHADMIGAFVQVFDPLVQPRRVGLKRAVLGCASLPVRVEQAVKANWPTEIEDAMGFVDACMKLLGRFYPPEMTGLPDEFASTKPAATPAMAPAEKPKSD